MQGIRQVRSGQYAVAIPCLERAHELQKHDSSALLYLGEAYLKTGRLKESIQVEVIISEGWDAAALMIVGPGPGASPRLAAKENFRVAFNGKRKITAGRQ